MIRLTRAQVREIDRRSIEDYGIPGIVLMENASRAAAAVALGMLSNEAARSVVIVCGPGNNGGDGFVAARILAQGGHRVSVHLLGRREQLKGDASLAARSWNGPVDTATRVASPQVLTQLGTITLPWMPDKGDLIIHRVEIIRGGEHIDLLKGGDPFTVLRREQQLERLQLDGMLTATMPVGGLRVGDVLRLTFSTTEKDATLGGNVQAFASLVADPFRVQFARERLIWPDGTNLHYKIRGDKITPTVTDSGGYHELVINEPVAKQPDMPDDAPPRYKQGIAIEATTFDSWQAISKVMAPLYATDGAIAPGSPLAAEVAKIEKATTDPTRRTALALSLVQDKVRYLFKGMDNGNYVPQKPADTWQLRYGDCKAKTVLLLAISGCVALGAVTYLPLACALRLMPCSTGGGVESTVQSAGRTPAAVWMPPSSRCRKLGSV